MPFKGGRGKSLPSKDRTEAEENKQFSLRELLHSSYFPGMAPFSHILPLRNQKCIPRIFPRSCFVKLLEIRYKFAMLGISRPHIKATVFSKVVKKSASARTICPGNGDLHITDRRWEVCHSFFWPHYLEIVQLVWRTLLFVNSSIFGGKIHWHGTNAPNRSPASSSLPPDFCKVSTQLDSSSRVARQNFGKKREVLWSLDTLLTKPFRRTESRRLFGASNLQNQFWHNLFKKGMTDLSIPLVA